MINGLQYSSKNEWTTCNQAAVKPCYSLVLQYVLINRNMQKHEAKLTHTTLEQYVAAVTIYTPTYLNIKLNAKLLL